MIDNRHATAIRAPSDRIKRYGKHSGGMTRKSGLDLEGIEAASLPDRIAEADLMVKDTIASGRYSPVKVPRTPAETCAQMLREHAEGTGWYWLYWYSTSHEDDNRAADEDGD